MVNLQDGKGKVQQICDILRKETIEPAQANAEALVKEGQAQARAIIAEAQAEAANIVNKAKLDMQKQQNIFESSLAQAASQTLAMLRQDIEKHIFNNSLVEAVEQASKDPQAVAKLIESIVSAVAKEGLSQDLTVLIPKSLSKEAFNAHLVQSILDKLSRASMEVANFVGGVKIRLNDKKMTIDISDATLKEMLANYLRKDFRKLLFRQDSSTPAENLYVR